MSQTAFHRWRLGLLTAAACSAALAPTAALAAPRDFRIAAKPLSEALVDFAVQADVFINSGAARGCRRLGNAVSGRMEATEALRRLLAGTGCAFEMVDARTVRIVRAPRPAARPVAAPPPRPEPPSGPTEVEEVIVTATRQPSVASRLPYSVSALPGTTLEQQGADDANDIALLTPGVTVTNLGPGRDKILIRGVSDGGLTGRVQSTVGIYLDDTRLTYNAPDPDLRLADVERVEVLRGPQGSLYGAGSIGGVFHIVSRKPQLGVFSGQASAEASYTAEGGAGYGWEAMVNTPLFSDRAALRVVAYGETTAGYIDDVGQGRDDVNATSRKGFRASAKAELGADWSLTAGIVSQSISAQDSQYVQTGLADLTRANRVAEPHHNDFSAAYVSLGGDTPYGRLRWTTSLLDHRLDTRYDASTALPAFGAPAGPAAPYRDRFSATTVVSELNLFSPLGARIPWLVGAFYSEGHEDQTSRLTTPALVHAEVRDDEVSEASLYGEVSYPWRRWTFTLGGRYFWASLETDSRVATAGAGEALFNGRYSESGFAPKLVARYQVSDRWIAYVQAAEGYRTGGFNTSGPVGQVFAPPGTDLQPARRYAGDELWSYEAGSKWTNPDRGLTLQGAVFLVSWEDIQSTQLLPSGLPYTANIGDGRVVGAELEAAWSVGDFTLSGNLLVSEPELTEPAAGFPGDADSALAGVPRFSLAVLAHYERPLQGGFTFTADAHLSYVGPSRLTFDAATAPAMGDYIASRLSAGVETDRWRLGAYIDNLADDRGDTFAYGNPFTLSAERQETPQRPRTFGVKLDVSF